MEKTNILFIFILIHFISSNYQDNWRDYPACRLGRMQSPIEINEYQSIYTNDFSFVYQDYREINDTTQANLNNDTDNYAFVANLTKGGYINFERSGVIKQYELLRAELYPGLHKINGDSPDYELHLVHYKNLDFKTNKNQYRRIQDPNMFLTIVLRYKKNCSEDQNIVCASDNGLLKDLKNNSLTSLGNYPVFQDKRAFLYEGSSMYIPCDENVNYYVIKDLFFCDDDIADFNLDFVNINAMEKYDRPVYKNFMNYREVLKSNFNSVKIISLFLIIFILF